MVRSLGPDQMAPTDVELLEKAHFFSAELEIPDFVVRLDATWVCRFGDEGSSSLQMPSNHNTEIIFTEEKIIYFSYLAVDFPYFSAILRISGCSRISWPSLGAPEVMLPNLRHGRSELPKAEYA